MQTFMLSKPTGIEPIPSGIQSFVSETLKNNCYHLVLDAFNKSGLSQADLAKRMDKDKALINRQLSTPSNWTIDTVARLLFAINGSIVALDSIGADSPSFANYTQPYWLKGRLPPPSAHGDGTTSLRVKFAAASSEKHPALRVFGGSNQEPKQDSPKLRIAAE